MIGFSEEDRNPGRAAGPGQMQNGVSGLKLLSGAEALALEPSLNPAVSCALLVPTSGIVSPYELTYALADDAALNGVSFRFGDGGVSVCPLPDGGFRSYADRGEWTCRILVNCAGASSAELHNQLCPES